MTNEDMQMLLKRLGHPRGFAGKKRTKDEIEKMKSGSAAAWANPDHRVNSDEYRQAVSDKSSLSARSRPSENQYSRVNNGWVEIGDRSFFARSMWEANYGRYLQFLKTSGSIKQWEYEPETFWFEKIRRGVRSYLPDFRVTNNDGSIIYHEVKGWMDGKSVTKLKRMAKYHPSVALIVIGAAWFKESKKFSALVPQWGEELLKRDSKKKSTPRSKSTN